MNDCNNSPVRTRRYRAAVYSQCGSAHEVDSVFDALTEMMLSERREDYHWGAIIDLPPSRLFRTFGDQEIEERIRYRFEKICSEYPDCGFFCILRSRRYSEKRDFRCEGGIYGALRSLLGGRSDGCTIRLSTRDGVRQSDRVFLWCVNHRDSFPLLPCDISRASSVKGAVIISNSRCRDSKEKRAFFKALMGECSGNYRVIGWLTFPLDTDTPISLYKLLNAKPPRKKQMERLPKNLEKAFSCTKEYFSNLPITESQAPISLPPRHGKADLCAALLPGYIALSEAGACKESDFREVVSLLLEEIRRSIGTEHTLSPGFVRISLLLTSAFCNGMGQYGDSFFTLANETRAMAEDLRIKYESDTCEPYAPFAPCEMVAFRPRASCKEQFFRGFTAPKRICDCFLYLFSKKGGVTREMFITLVSKGFDEQGVIAASDYRPFVNSLLLSLYAQIKSNLFSRLSLLLPELRGCESLFSLLPEDGWRPLLQKL